MARSLQKIQKKENQRNVEKQKDQNENENKWKGKKTREK